MNPEVYEQMPEVEDGPRWFRARRAIAQHMIRRLDLPKPATILEAGMGRGGNWPMLSEYGEVHGFEPRAPAREAAKKNAGTEIPFGSLPANVPDWQGRQFHLIVCLDVLEHIDDDVASVRALSGLLHPGGYILRTVPALQSLWSYYDESHEHKRRYSHKTLRRVLAVRALELVNMSYTGFFLFPLIYGVRLMNKLLRRIGDDLRLPGLLPNSALCAITSFDRPLVSRVGLPVGSSLLAIVRKRC
jgi:SAM-dependent methyltransferase